MCYSLARYQKGSVASWPFLGDDTKDWLLTAPTSPAFCLLLYFPPFSYHLLFSREKKKSFDSFFPIIPRLRVLTSLLCLPSSAVSTWRICNYRRLEGWWMTAWSHNAEREGSFCPGAIIRLETSLFFSGRASLTSPSLWSPQKYQVKIYCPTGPKL